MAKGEFTMQTLLDSETVVQLRSDLYALRRSINKLCDLLIDHRPKPPGPRAAPIEERIEAFMQRRGCMSEREIYRQLHLSHTDAVRALNILGAAGLVNMTTNSRPRMLHYAPHCKCYAVTQDSLSPESSRDAT
jgi:hypothetical protein